MPRGPRALYLLIAAQIHREATKHAVPILTVDGSRDVDETVAAVESLFAEALVEGPRAETLAERRALLREANRAIVSQVREGRSRPWADGGADVTIREFLCECGDRACAAGIWLAVGAVFASPALAPGHG